VTGWSVLWLGVGLGLRHAIDAEHVVVVSALVQREPGLWRAARIAALWGTGHTAAFLGVGLLVVLAGVHVPASFEEAAEVLVAAMLIGLGLWNLRALGRTAEPSMPARAPTARPLFLGLVHGLAGSAGIALLTATTIDSRAFAALYLALFGLGTVLGMVLLTMLLSRPIAWIAARGAFARNLTTGGAALVSVGLGIAIVLQT